MFVNCLSAVLIQVFRFYKLSFSKTTYYKFINRLQEKELFFCLDKTKKHIYDFVYIRVLTCLSMSLFLCLQLGALYL